MSRLKRIYLIGSIVLLLAPIFVIHYQDGLYTNIHNDKAFDSERFALRKLNSDGENFDTSPGRMFRGESKERAKYIIDDEAIIDDKRSIENKTLGGFGNKYLRANLKLTEGENRMENNVGRRHNSPGPPPFGRRKVLPHPQNPMPTFTSASDSLMESMKLLRSSANFVSRKYHGKKIILIFVKSWYIPIIQRIDFQRCEVKNCVLTQERSTIRQASAVIFNHFEIRGGPPPKPKDQLWIFHTEEPPFYTKADLHRAWQGMFNYTMTYRRDSDFSDAYGRLERRKIPLRRDYNRIFDEKRADVAMFESNCGAPSRRQEYVKMLMKFIRVDVYGKCGRFKCGRRDFYSVDDCHAQVSKNYKFYLVFENSICNDYTTEKFYTLFETGFPIVPVVRGAQNILDYVPSKLFINTYDFERPKDLAMHLIQLGNDRERYINFLKTMDGYSSPSHAQIFHESMCKLCSLLNSPIKSSQTVDVYRFTWERQCPVVKPAGVIDEKYRKKSK